MAIPNNSLKKEEPPVIIGQEAIVEGKLGRIIKEDAGQYWIRYYFDNSTGIFKTDQVKLVPINK